MTTEPTSADERAARLEALRRRRSAPRTAAPAGHDGPGTATARPRPSARRHHAATGGRILVGSLSGAAALGLMAAMASGAGPGTDPPTTVPGDAAAASPVVVIRRSDGTTEIPTAAAPPVAPTATAPVTTSRGS